MTISALKERASEETVGEGARPSHRGAATKAPAKRLPMIKAKAACCRDKEEPTRMVSAVWEQERSCTSGQLCTASVSLGFV